MEEHSHLWNEGDYKCPEDNRETIKFEEDEVKRICHILKKETASLLAETAL